MTVGSASRARSIASFLDATPKPFSLSSERGFITITGRYKAVPVSIISIGMGSPNVDFFIREVRESLSGDMVVIRSVSGLSSFIFEFADSWQKRLGSCGCLTELPVGSVVVPRASVAVTRNYDFDFVTGNPQECPYNISKPVDVSVLLQIFSFF